MNKKFKLFASALPLFAAAGCLIGCDGNSGSNDDIFTITYYAGGYGSKWIEDFAKETLALERGCSPDEIKKNVDFKMISDSDPAKESTLKSSKKCPDLIFANGIYPNYISAGLIEPIQDVYETKVQTSQGEKTIQEYLIPDCMEQYRMRKMYGQGQRLPWAIPLTNIPISIAYNETILQKTTHVDSYNCGDLVDATTHKWVRPPETVNQLKSYFLDLDASGQKLINLGWSMADGSNWFEPFYATWWAQYQGVDVQREGHGAPGEGSYYDFWKCETAESYKQKGIQVAFDTLRDLIVDTNTHKFKNSHPSYATYTIKDMQSAFARGEMAMCLTGDFFEHEYSDILAKSNDVFKIMRIPSIEDPELNEKGETKKLTFVNTSNVLFIPKGAKHKDIAKKFLIYSSQEAQVIRFLKETGGIRPFQFDRSLIDDIEFTDFQKSTLDLYFDRDDLLMKFPRNLEDKSTISPYYIYKNLGATLFSVVDYATLLYGIRDYSSEEICTKGVYQGQTAVFRSLYARAEEAYAQWRKIYG